MRILVTGAGGQVGSELLRRSTPAVEIRGVPRGALDITDSAATAHAIEHHRPQVVVNAAAYTAVDRAESEPDVAATVNADGARTLARTCAQHRIPLIHFSTDYVFAGGGSDPVPEDAPTAPLNEYGRSKLHGEAAVRSVLAPHIILRTSWVFSAHGHNFVLTALRLAREREEMRIVSDQWGCPTWAGDLAEVTLALVDRFERHGQLPWGTYHCCGTPPTTWWGFAEEIVKQARRFEALRVKTIHAISTPEFPTPARRPPHLVLSCTKLESTFGITPRPWRAGVFAVMKELYRG